MTECTEPLPKLCLYLSCIIALHDQCASNGQAMCKSTHIAGTLQVLYTPRPDGSHACMRACNLDAVRYDRRDKSALQYALGTGVRFFAGDAPVALCPTVS